MPHFALLPRPLSALLAAVALVWTLMALPAVAQEGVPVRSESSVPKPAKVLPGLDAPARKLAEVGAVPSAVDSDYKITPSDLLDIDVFGVSELKRTVRVNASGQISMPLIGSVTVAGLTPADAEAMITGQYPGKP